MPPILTVLLYSAVSAACGGLGALVLLWRRQPPRAWLGWSNAVAAGTMVSAAFLLTTAGRAGATALPEALGGALGVLFIHWTHAALGTAGLDLNRPGETDPTYGYKVVLVNLLHSASEGVAIGVAMVADLSFGIFMALAIAAHNIAEGAVLGAVLAGRGLRLGGAAALAVTANVSQVLLAVTVFAIASAVPGVLPWAMGFAVGALVNLVLVELLPESYHQAGTTSIAVVASIAMGLVVLLQGLVP